jgi:hypothetical protein
LRGSGSLIELKIKLSALWGFLALGALAPLVFAIWMPGVIDQLITGVVFGEVIS